MTYYVDPLFLYMHINGLSKVKGGAHMRKAVIGLIIFNVLGSICSAIIEKEAIEKFAEIKANSKNKED